MATYTSYIQSFFSKTVPGSRHLGGGANQQRQACWKTEVINNLFLPHKAEMIRGIPISSRMLADKQIWALDSNGIFMVKSAYYGALGLSRLGSVASSSDVSHEKRFWKLLWSLPVPHKIRHFAW